MNIEVNVTRIGQSSTSNTRRNQILTKLPKENKNLNMQIKWRPIYMGTNMEINKKYL